MKESPVGATGLAHQGDAVVCDPPHACLGCLATSGLSMELTKDQVEALFGIVEVRRLYKGEVLITEGEYDDHLYVVAKSEFEVTRGKTDDTEVELARLCPGTATGELAFLGGLERTATVTAADDGACVIALQSSDLESLLVEHPQLVFKVMRAILRSAHRTVSKMDASHIDMLRYIQS